MKKSAIILSPRDLSKFNNEVDYDTSNEKYCLYSSKRKRKPNTPQKLEVSDDEKDEITKNTHFSIGQEPINLKKRLIEAPEYSPMDMNPENSLQNPSGNSLDNNRLYSVLLNYMVMKYHNIANSKTSSMANDISLMNAHGNGEHPIPLHATESNLSSLNLSPKHSTPKSFGENLMLQNGLSFGDGLLSLNHKPEALFSDTQCKQTIMQLINTCINTVPTPKTSYANYELMLLYYKGVIEKANAFKMAIDYYLNMIQTCVSCETGKSNHTNGCSNSSSNNYHINRSSFSENCFSNDMFTINDKYQPYVKHPEYHSSSEDQPVLKHPKSECCNSNNAFSYNIAQIGGEELKSEQIPISQMQMQSPVDLTNSNKTTPKLGNLPNPVPSEEYKVDDYHKNNKENADYYAKFLEYIGLNRNACSSNLSPVSSSIFCQSASEQYDLSRTIGIPMISKTNPQSPISECSISSSNQNHIMQQRKKTLKSKRMKKAFTSQSSSNTNMITSDMCLMKKSNFRGTSEEENKVAQDFKPIEINGHVLLSESLPSVRLSKDIFYSLIVKSSGSATRLIRLLMKSFFTQDELAASSLSGEGIYKQRLEPNVTEAIKVFIRRRHPKLKTGSINLCMTDVCVQARRVANNQRSRQHVSSASGLPSGGQLLSPSTSAGTVSTPTACPSTAAAAAAVNPKSSVEADEAPVALRLESDLPVERRGGEVGTGVGGTGAPLSALSSFGSMSALPSLSNLGACVEPWSMSTRPEVQVEGNVNNSSSSSTSNDNSAFHSTSSDLRPTGVTGNKEGAETGLCYSRADQFEFVVHNQGEEIGCDGNSDALVRSAESQPVDERMVIGVEQEGAEGDRDDEMKSHATSPEFSSTETESACL